MSDFKECRACREKINISKLQRLDGKNLYCFPFCAAATNPQRRQEKVAAVVHLKEKLLKAVTAGLSTVPDMADELDITSTQVIALLVDGGGDYMWDLEAQEWVSTKRESEVQTDVQVRKLKTELNEQKKRYTQALEQIDSLSNDLSAYKSLDSTIPISIPTLTNTGFNDSGEAMAIALLSDHHYAKAISPQSVNGLNEYSLDIAQQRLQAVFRNIVGLTELNRNGVKIPHLLLWLGGDLVEGVLREENLAYNNLSYTEELLFAYEHIVSGIDYLLNHGNFENIYVMCNDGNHGRRPFSHKTPSSGRTEQSLETMLYHQIARRYSNSPKIHFQIAEGDLLYFSMYDKTLRFFHGDRIKYGGGVLGAGVPVAKYVARQDQGIKADYNFLGHFHTLNFFANTVMNGSLCGSDAYGMQFGFEQPQQAYVLLDQEHGMTARFPIHCN